MSSTELKQRTKGHKDDVLRSGASVCVSFIPVSLSAKQKKSRNCDKQQGHIWVGACGRVYLSDHLILVGVDEARQTACQRRSYQLKTDTMRSMAAANDAYPVTLAPSYLREGDTEGDPGDDSHVDLYEGRHHFVTTLRTHSVSHSSNRCMDWLVKRI